MISQPRLPSAAGAALLLALAACQGPDTPVSNPEGQAAAPENEKVLFSENFSDAGSFQIMADPSGGFNSIVQAGIGSEAERLLVASSAQPTLAEVYRSLHGGANEVPAVVAQASEHFEARKPSSREISPSAVPLAKAVSQSGFQTSLCRNFLDGSWKWNVSDCVWDGNRNFLRVEGVNSDGYYPDRVYAWNKTAWTGTMSLASGSPFYPSPNPWKPTIAPYGVGWIQWGGTYSNAVAMIALPSGKYGELGLTDHYATPYVK
jgi:hypothetical protein